jgi:SAM-dependent methyltransferase
LSLDEYRKACEAEAKEIVDALPSWGLCSVVDIGCGIGGVTAALGCQDRLLLIDRDHCGKVYYGYREQAAFYNSLSLAEQCVSRECPDAAVTAFAATDDRRIPWDDSEATLVLSTLAIGFHEPWEGYRPEILRVLASDGCLVLDVRRGTGQIESLLASFAALRCIHEREKYQRVLCEGPLLP